MPTDGIFVFHYFKVSTHYSGLLAHYVIRITHWKGSYKAHSYVIHHKPKIITSGRSANTIIATTITTTYKESVTISFEPPFP